MMKNTNYTPLLIILAGSASVVREASVPDDEFTACVAWSEYGHPED